MTANNITGTIPPHQQTSPRRFWVVFMVCTLFPGPTHSFAQVVERLPMAGFRLGTMIGNTSLTQDPGYLTSIFFRRKISRQFYEELDLGYGTMGGKLYRTRLIPVDYRLMFVPQWNASHAAHVYAGAGGTNYRIQTRPSKASRDAKNSGWAVHLPVGLGLSLMLGEVADMDLNAGYNFALTDDLDAVRTGHSDGFWTVEVGLSFGGQRDEDPDRDGILTKDEIILGTDPFNRDTDRDSLADGDEVRKYRTDPRKADTDGDGLTDGEEVLKYHTNPLKADTDEDGLKDSSEIRQYRTDPVRADADNDGLVDGDEVMKYHTDPLKVDTDDDGLSDGDEVKVYHTNPLKVDTDGGTIPDGLEVRRKTNPLDPGDDVTRPGKEELKIEINKPIVLDGVIFRFGSAVISAESGPILEKALNTLEQHPYIEVEIHGHTDNVGLPDVNLRVSRARAEAVKMYLVRNGILANRIVTRGFGSDRPIAPNTTAEGRQRNRRIEFVRVR